MKVNWLKLVGILLLDIFIVGLVKEMFFADGVTGGTTAGVAGV